jgi:hypothetical protein
MNLEGDNNVKRQANKNLYLFNSYWQQKRDSISIPHSEKKLLHLSRFSLDKKTSTIAVNTYALICPF